MIPDCWICSVPVEDDDACTVHIECATSAQFGVHPEEVEERIKRARSETIDRLRAALHVDNWDPAVSEIPGREERIYAAVVKRALDDEEYDQ